MPGIEHYARKAARNGYIYASGDRVKRSAGNRFTRWVVKLTGYKVEGQALLLRSAFKSRYLDEAESFWSADERYIGRPLKAKHVREVMWRAEADSDSRLERNQDKVLQRLLALDPEHWDYAVRLIARFQYDLDDVRRLGPGTNLKETFEEEEKDLAARCGMSQDEIDDGGDDAGSRSSTSDEDPAPGPSGSGPDDALRFGQGQEQPSFEDEGSSSLDSGESCSVSPINSEDIAEGRAYLDQVRAGDRESAPGPTTGNDLFRAHMAGFAARRTERQEKVEALCEKIYELLGRVRGIEPKLVTRAVAIARSYSDPVPSAQAICAMAAMDLDAEDVQEIEDAIAFYGLDFRFGDCAEYAYKCCLSKAGIIAMLVEKDYDTETFLQIARLAFRYGYRFDDCARLWDAGATAEEIALLNNVPTEHVLRLFQDCRRLKLPVAEDTIPKRWSDEQGVASSELGKGSFNTVYKVTFTTTDGVKLIKAFKPLAKDPRAEHPAGSDIVGIDARNPQGPRRELAAQAFADLCIQASVALGQKRGFPENLLPHSEIAYLTLPGRSGPELGVLMDLIDGASGDQTPDRYLIWGETRRQGVWAAEFDHGCAHFDRHAGNYKVDARGNVRLYDNEDTFGPKIKNPRQLVRNYRDPQDPFNGVDLPNVVDTEMVAVCEWLTDERIDARYRGNLSDKEIAAIKNRLAVMRQNHLDLEAQGWIIDPSEWSDPNVLQRLDYRSDYLARDTDLGFDI